MSAHTMTEEEAGKLERLEKAATPGPWREDTDPGCTGVIGPDGYMIADCMIVSLRKGAPTQARCDSNARLIAAMRNALPALLSTSTALREMREVNEWRPIETAPKDGAPLDLWLGNDEDPHRRTDCYWGRPHHECGEYGSYCDSCPPDRDMWVDPLSMGYEDLQPTHWRYPPPAPAIEKATKP